MKNLWFLLAPLKKINLVTQIIIGILAGGLLATLAPEHAISLGFLGTLFVNALKAVAPILVFVLVAASIAKQKKGQDTKLGPVITLYLLGTFMAAIIAVSMSFLFPTNLNLVINDAVLTPPNDISDVLTSLLLNIVDNPINALMTGNFIGILAWAVGLGFALHHASDNTKTVFADIAESVSFIVRFIITLAPIGIFGLVAKTLAETGFSALLNYAHLLAVLIGCMLIIALVVNPIIVFMKTKINPYPLVFECLRTSGITAFFTRSSAANIPVNMQLCEKLNLNKDTYSVSIPLGATINMAGAATTITVLTLAAVHTLGISVDIPTAILLSLVASVSACGASGVAGGSLLLIPLACNLFGIPNDIALQVVGVGFIIGVLQDSAETALNSSTDVVFTAAACMAIQQKQAKAAALATNETTQ